VVPTPAEAKIGRVDRQRDRHQVFGGIERHFGVETWIDHELDVGRHQNRVAVGRGFGDAIAADIAAGAGDIFDHHRLAPELAQPVGHDAGDDVDRSRRRIADDHAHRVVRVTALRNGAAGCCKYRKRGDQRGGYFDFYCYRTLPIFLVRLVHSALMPAVLMIGPHLS
jgi:hypothetical protein